MDRLVHTMLASAEGFRSLAHAAGGVASTVEGVLCWHSKSHVPLFNGAAIVSGAQINQDTLDALCAYFIRVDPLQSFSVLTLDELTPGALRQMAHYGYREHESFPAMWIDLVEPPVPDLDRPAPPDLEVVRVESPEQLGTFRDVLRRVFFMPQEEVELILSDRALEATHVRHYLGFVGEQPVATATSVLGGHVAGVWNVGTLSPWERKGIGGAVMHALLSDAYDLGYRASMLLSSGTGLPFYERLGYTTLDTMRVSAPDLKRDA